MQLLVQCRPNYLGCILSCSLLFWVTESRREILHNTCITINTANSLAFLTHKSLLFFTVRWTSYTQPLLFTMDLQWAVLSVPIKNKARFINLCMSHIL